MEDRPITVPSKSLSTSGEISKVGIKFRDVEELSTSNNLFEDSDVPAEEPCSKYEQYETLKRGYNTKFDYANPAGKYDRVVPGGSKSPSKK